MKTFIKSHGRLLAGVLIGILLLGVWAWFAGGARQQASFRRTDERVAQVKMLVKSAFSGSRIARLSAINSLSKLPTKGMCHGDWWNEWQQAVIASIKSDADRCRQQERKVQNTVRAAQAIQDYSTADTGIAKQLAALKVDTTAPDWPLKAKAAAIRAAQAINSIRAISTAEPVQKSAKEHVAAILAAWDALNAASSKQDKDAYLAAEAQLKQAYADLAAISDVSDAQLATLLARLQTASKAL